MILDPKKISEVIRAKKKKLLLAEPELVDTDLRPDMNANDMADVEMDARIQSTLKTPPKSDQREADAAMSDEDAMTMGLSEKEMGRMSRLRKYLDTLD